MATFIELDDPADVRLGDYVKLRDTQLRHSLESERGLFIAEGEKVIRRAVEAGYRPRSFLLARRWIDGLGDLLDAAKVDVYVVTEQLAEQVTGFHVHRGALASLHRSAPCSVDEVLRGTRVVVAEDIVDHTNIGAIIRSAAALGWDGVLLSPRCADPLYRRSIKTSMGTVFSLPWARMDDDQLAVVKAAGHLVVAAALTEDAVTLDEPEMAAVEAAEKVALLVGTEGAGLSADWIAAADQVVSIPMAAGVDSLNVAAATAVLCWQLRRRIGSTLGSRSDRQ